MQWTEEITEKPRYGKPYKRKVQRREEVDLYHCTSCGSALINAEAEGRPWNTTTELVGKGDKKNKTNRMQQQCPECSAPLWQLTPFAKGGRWPVAEFLSQNYGGQYALAIDECHHSKGGETAIGQAAMDLISGASRTILLTGTLYNGYASSLFYLFYRTVPQFRQLYSHTDKALFVAHHGLTETITRTTTRSTSANGYGREDERSYTHEAPGATPNMIRMMMPYVVFLTLDELGVNLPPKTEYVVGVEYDDSLKPGLEALKAAEGAAKLALAISEGKNKGPHSRWWNAAMGWPDCPLGEIIEIGGKAGDVTIPAAIMPEKGYAKDRELIKLIKRELMDDRGIGVFFQQVHKRNAMNRIQGLLKTEGIESFILDVNTAKPEVRMEWIEGKVEESRLKGQEPVLLCNGALVKEGLDLIFLPALACFGQEFNTFTLLQMLRRSWRLGQTKDVRIYFFYYLDTEQEKATQHIAIKVRAAGQINGQVAEGIAEFNMDGDQFMQELMKAAKAVDGGKLAMAMQTAHIEDVGAFRPKVKKVLQPAAPILRPAAPVIHTNGRANGRSKPKKHSGTMTQTNFLNMDGTVKPMKQMSLGF